MQAIRTNKQLPPESLMLDVFCQYPYEINLQYSKRIMDEMHPALETQVVIVYWNRLNYCKPKIMDGLRVVVRRLDPAIVKQKTCDFCSRTENDELLYGRLYSLEDVTAHYYCLLFASHLQQKGSDNEGIFGFMLPDMKNVLKVAENDGCSYCDKSGATIVCVQRMCRKVFHLPCGIENGSLHHFFGRFQSFCKLHRDRPKVPQTQVLSREAAECAICLELTKRDSCCITSLWAPCCKINAWLHRLCAQKLALSSGYFFKCPRCNNKDIFIAAMRKYGIYIPEKDASWELEPHAFEELLHRHGRCDAESCVCPFGREHDKDDTDWEVILCESCGSQGMHIGCLPYKCYARKWYCTICAPISQQARIAEITGTVSTLSTTCTTTSITTSVTTSVTTSTIICTTTPAVAEGSSSHPERKRTAQWVDSNPATKCAKMEQENLASCSSSDSREADVGGAEEEDCVVSCEDEDSDIEVEVVDVEEDQKTPDRLLTRYGIEIPVVTFNDPILDNTIDITGDIKWDSQANENVEEIVISDTEDSDTQMSIKSSNSGTICLD